MPCLISASREAALNAIQAYNNPLTTFKSETFIVNMNIAWTYLLHAYYVQQSIEIRYHRVKGRRRRFDRTPGGDFRFRDLSKCIGAQECPLEREVVANLEFMIGLRNEIVHKGTTELDDALSPKFLANCLNFERTLVALFGEKHSAASHLRFALQLRDLVHPEQFQVKPLPSYIASYIANFETDLPESVVASPAYAYRVFIARRSANRPNQADRVIEFVPEDSEIAKSLNKQYLVIKHRDPPKFRPGDIVKRMQELGFDSFDMHEHTRLWKETGAKSPQLKLGIDVAGTWFWYEEWIEVVSRHCETNSELYAVTKLTAADRKKVVVHAIRQTDGRNHDNG